MKKLSVKLKITLWLTLMMTFLSGLLLAFMFSMSSTIVTQTSMSQLSQTLRVNLSLISSSDGQLQLDDGFQFYQNGISSLVYSKNGTLIAGQIPVSFKSDEPFENGVTRAQRFPMMTNICFSISGFPSDGTMAYGSAVLWRLRSSFKPRITFFGPPCWLCLHFS